jgi:hypothetical protein
MPQHENEDGTSLAPGSTKRGKIIGRARVMHDSFSEGMATPAAQRAAARDGAAPGPAS